MLKSTNNITKIVLSFIIIYLIMVIYFQEGFINLVANCKDLLFNNLYFLFFDVINIVLVVLLVVSFTRLGRIKIGGKKAKPDYSNISWYAMLFSAGMGIGIMFYAVAEPLDHFYTNYIYQGSSDVTSALATTYFSWGVHAWAVYGLVGLTFAFFHFNRNLPLTLRSLFYPLFKDKIYGGIGDVIDATGVIITLFALSASLGIGALQINSGLSYVFGIPVNIKVQIVIIICVIFIVILSVLSGVGKGVKILSENNFRFAALLGGLLLIIGPTLIIIKYMITSTITYFVGLPVASLQINSAPTTWTSEWGIFYMAWWISWSIFIGIFIAKISKGRTVREFILSILIIPTLISIVWFSILGVNALELESSQQISQLINQDISLSLFIMIDELVNNNIFNMILQIISLIIIISFFITSSDSGAIVINELVLGGEGDNSKKEKVFWTSMQGILTIVIILAGGTLVLNLIQDTLIIISLPLTFVLVYILIIFVKEIIKESKLIDYRIMRNKTRKKKLSKLKLSKNKIKK